MCVLFTFFSVLLLKPEIDFYSILIEFDDSQPPTPAAQKKKMSILRLVIENYKISLLT